MAPELRRRFEKSLFPEGISYQRGQGFGTTKLGLIYNISQECHGSKTRLVPLVIDSWNLLLDELLKVAEIGREYNAGKKEDASNDEWYDVEMYA